MWWIRIRAGLLAGCVAGVFGLGSGAPAVAQSSEVVVVGNDRGGSVADRAFIVDRLRAYGARVEIRGDICYSACTMYLGAGDVCVDPNTDFGFHGPSNMGIPISEERFSRWSEVMGRYYNAPLREWFMEEARFTTGLLRLSGSQIINAGYQAC